MELKKAVRQQLEKLFDMRYKRKKKHYTDYDVWAKDLEQTEEDGGRQEAEQAPQEAVLLTFAGGMWRKDAQKRMDRFFAQNPEVLLAYGDEDIIERKGVFSTPWLKPCWSPDSYLCRDYLGSALAVRKSLFEQLTEEECQDEGLCHDRLVALAGGFKKDCRTIAHVDGIFFHRLEKWELPEEGRSGKRIPLQETDGRKAGKVEHTKEAGMEDDAVQAANTLVSVIIPSKNNVSVLKKCLETLCRTVTETDYEIIVVDNGSSAKNREAVSRETDRLNHEVACGAHLHRAVYLYKPMEFNFSRMCNLGAKEAKGNLLLFLNDDIEAVKAGWLEEMVQKALQPWTGAVGCKLLYPDGERIQHAGVVNIALGPTHRLQYLEDSARHYDGRNRGVWNMIAVTGACLMLERAVFKEAGGFCEKLRVAFNDIDLCFTLYELGYHNVVINSGFLLHHESLSRGTDETDEQMKRLMSERDMLYARHPKLEGKDPYYHVGLNGSIMDTAIKPSFEEGILFDDTREYDTAMNLSKARLDECLMLRIELADKERVSGYAMVLGSNNACFKKQLLFQKTDDSDILYSMDFTEQYRSDLEKNTDQINVALCGFNVKFAGPLPSGEYRIGIMARDQISGAELINWSSRTIATGKGRKKKTR